MERVAYTLGDALGLPLPATYLERVGGEAGSLQLRLPDNARTWNQAGASPMMMTTVQNEDLWPLCVAFDLWIANYDRHPGNIMLEPVPPETLPQRATTCLTWLIDNGISGLWYPSKFDPPFATVEDVIVPSDGRLSAVADVRLRTYMPRPYRRAFTRLSDTDRGKILDLIRAVPDNRIQSAVAEVPTPYFSRKARSRTTRLLVARRDAIGTLATDVFGP